MEANEEWKSKLLDKRLSCKQNERTGKTVASYFLGSVNNFKILKNVTYT